MMRTTIYRGAAALFAASILWTLALAVRDPSGWMVPAALAGWFFADLVSGVTHMALDYRPCRPGRGLRELYVHEGPRDTPDYLARKRAVFARVSPLDRLLFDFKTHHPRPDALGRRSLLVQVGSTLVAVLPPSLLLAVAATLGAVPGWALLGAAVALLGAGFSQFFHGQLHRERAAAPVRWMRGLGLLCTPAYHRRHHETLRHDFATVNGWSNPLLNRAFAALRARGHLADAGLEPH